MLITILQSLDFEIDRTGKEGQSGAAFRSNQYDFDTYLSLFLQWGDQSFSDDHCDPTLDKGPSSRPLAQDGACSPQPCLAFPNHKLLFSITTKSRLNHIQAFHTSIRMRGPILYKITLINAYLSIHGSNQASGRIQFSTYVPNPAHNPHFLPHLYCLTRFVSVPFHRLISLFHFFLLRSMNPRDGGGDLAAGAAGERAPPA